MTAPITTCFYDGDCGVCTALSEWGQRVIGQRVDMRPNSDREALPPGVTHETTDRSIVVVTPDGRVLTRVRAVAAVARLLPGGPMYAWVLLVPGLRQLFGLGYDYVSAHRRQISERLGMTACKVPDRS